MKIEIKHRFTGKIIVTGDASIKATITKAVKDGADLGGADLGGAYLGGADLGGAYLRGADLGGAYLRGAYLGGADLGGAYLRGADLGGADLGGADLGGAYLRGADLGGAYLGEIKQYSESHDIFFELVGRGNIEIFSSLEWEIIGKLSIHRLCWGSIRKRFKEAIIPIFKRLADKGFDEYLKRYEDDK